MRCARAGAWLVLPVAMLLLTVTPSSVIAFSGLIPELPRETRTADPEVPFVQEAGKAAVSDDAGATTEAGHFRSSVGACVADHGQEPNTLHAPLLERAAMSVLWLAAAAARH
jgi:hypothetical protein